MKTTFINVASVIIESNDVKRLCDPWFEGRAYYGSWAIYPPMEVDSSVFDDIDYVYIYT